VTTTMPRSRRSFAGSKALFFAALTVLSAGALAQNYTVTFNPTLNDLDVKFDYQADEDILLVTVINDADRKVRCDFRYDAGPQLPYFTSTFVPPAGHALSVFRATRYWFAVVVNVTCVAVPA
jgi:hypothetical protein